MYWFNFYAICFSVFQASHPQWEKSQKNSLSTCLWTLVWDRDKMSNSLCSLYIFYQKFCLYFFNFSYNIVFLDSIPKSSVDNILNGVDSISLKDREYDNLLQRKVSEQIKTNILNFYKSQHTSVLLLEEKNMFSICLFVQNFFQIRDNHAFYIIKLVYVLKSASFN